MTVFEGIIAVVGCAAIFIGVMVGIRLFSSKVMGVELTSRTNYSATKTALEWAHKENLAYLESYTPEEIANAKNSLKSKFLANTSDNLVKEIIKLYGVREKTVDPLFGKQINKPVDEASKFMDDMITRKFEREKREKEIDESFDKLFKDMIEKGKFNN
jgi:hypothetical protein